MAQEQHNPDATHERLTQIFRNSFDRPTLVIQDSFSSKHIPGWDSLMQVNLIVSVEEEFGVRFTSKEIVAFECIGDMKRTISAKQKAA